MTELSGDDRLYLDDLHIGRRFASGIHVVDEGQIKAFARFTLITRLPMTPCFRAWRQASIASQLSQREAASRVSAPACEPCESLGGPFQNHRRTGRTPTGPPRHVRGGVAAVDLKDDVGSGLCPDKRFGVRIVMRNVVVDGGFKFWDTFESAATDAIGGDCAEPSPDEIKP
jgi:hypothetical protein